MMKEIIDFDAYKFEIRVMPHKQGNGLFITNENGREHLLVQCWTAGECKSWLHSHFIGKKGTKLQLTIEESIVVVDENGHLYRERIEGGN